VAGCAADSLFATKPIRPAMKLSGDHLVGTQAHHKNLTAPVIAVAESGRNVAVVGIPGNHQVFSATSSLDGHAMIAGRLTDDGYTATHVRSFSRRNIPLYSVSTRQNSLKSRRTRGRDNNAPGLGCRELYHTFVPTPVLRPAPYWRECSARLAVGQCRKLVDDDSSD
jgi:hypothetical protein